MSPSDRAVSSLGLWPLACWYSGFESHLRCGYLPLVNVMCCCNSMPLRRANHSSRGVLSSENVSFCVITCKTNLLHIQRLGRNRLDKNNSRVLLALIFTHVKKLQIYLFQSQLILNTRSIKAQNIFIPFR